MKICNISNLLHHNIKKFSLYILAIEYFLFHFKDTFVAN